MSANEIVRQIIRLTVGDDHRTEDMAQEIFQSDVWANCFEGSSTEYADFDDVLQYTLKACQEAIAYRQKHPVYFHGEE